MHGFLNIEQIKKFLISDFVFKFNRGLLPKAFSTYFVMALDIHAYLTRSARDYRVTFSRTNIRSFSIKTTVPNIWNDLPSHLSLYNSSPCCAMSFLLENFVLVDLLWNYVA